MNNESQPNDPQFVLDALDDLLEREKAALVAGDLESIAHLLEQKEALFDQLNGLPLSDTPDLEELRDKVTRNQALLDSALKGIRAVAARMSAMRKIRRSLDTYDERGQRQTIEGQRGSQLEKRA